jgi:hypothetical protein
MPMVMAAAMMMVIVFGHNRLSSILGRLGRGGGHMQRRTFLIRSSGLMISVAAGLGSAHARSTGDRVGLGTVTFRSRFEQTKPKTVNEIKDPLTLLTVPAYYRERFDIRRGPAAKSRNGAHVGRRRGLARQSRGARQSRASGWLHREEHRLDETDQ